MKNLRHEKQEIKYHTQKKEPDLECSTSNYEGLIY